jgi:hypothetical protein
MIASILAAFGLARIPAGAAPPEGHGVRRVRWRGSDGRWHWQAA